jgi:hypothetical protein
MPSAIDVEPQYQCWHGELLKTTELCYWDEFTEQSSQFASVHTRAAYHGFKNGAADANGGAGGGGSGARVFPGERRMLNIEDALENGLTWVRHELQRQFHNICLQSLAPLIVGDDWALIGERMCRERGWDSTDIQICAAAAARRFGKSIAVACLAAVLALFGPPNLPQGIFSTGQRVSGYLGSIVYTTLVESGYAHTVVRHNQEELWVMPDAQNPTDIRKLSYFPANPDIRNQSFLFFLFFFLLAPRCTPSAAPLRGPPFWGASLPTLTGYEPEVGRAPLPARVRARFA